MIWHKNAMLFRAAADHAMHTLAHKLPEPALQVRKLSVQRITSPLTYDNLNNIVTGGLYDPTMGPVDQNARCVWKEVTAAAAAAASAAAASAAAAASTCRKAYRNLPQTLCAADDGPLVALNAPIP